MVKGQRLDKGEKACAPEKVTWVNADCAGCCSGVVFCVWETKPKHTRGE
jgi:hypothetical protein